MGKPGWGHAQSLRSEHIGPAEGTGGTETSKYSEEEKAIANPLVAASETGPAQTSAVYESPTALLWGGCGTRWTVRRRCHRVTKAAISRTRMESRAADGNSPVGEGRLPLSGVPKYHGGYSV